TPSSLYNHFSGKQALYEAVLERGLRPIVDLVAAAPSGVLGPAQLAATIERLIRHLAVHPHLARLLQRALLEDGQLQAAIGRWAGTLYAQGVGVLRGGAVDAGWELAEVPHLALAIGDLSPLYLDEDYARGTRWGTLLAPPIIVQSMDTLRAVGSSGLPEGLPGVHSIWTGSRYEWARPVKLGDRIRADCYLKELVEKESTFGGGRSLYQTYEAVYYDHEGQRLGLRNDTWIRIERAATRDRKKYGDIALAQWTSEDVRRFQDEYRNQQRTVRRAWDDVRV